MSKWHKKPQKLSSSIRHKVIYHIAQTRALTVDMSHVMQPAGVLLLGLVLLLLQPADDDDDDARFTWQRL